MTSLCLSAVVALTLLAAEPPPGTPPAPAPRYQVSRYPREVVPLSAEGFREGRTSHPCARTELPATRATAPGGPSPSAAGASPAPSVEFDSLYWSGINRPDSAIAAGPDQLMTAVNFALWVQDFAGRGLRFARLADFFPDDPTGSIGDPRLLYDAASGRFILAALGFDYAGRRSWCDLAISATSDATGVWYKYSFDVVRGVPPLTEQMDFPSLGMDGVAIYLSARTRDFATVSVTGNRTLILDRALALSGQPLTPIVIDDLELPGAPGVRAEILKPVEPAEPVLPTSPGYFLTVADGASLALYTISDPLGTPAINGVRLATPPWQPAGAAPQPGGAPALWQAVGFPLHKTTIRDGVIWSSQSPSATGIAGERAGVRIYRIDPGVPQLLASHTLSDPDLWYYLPAVVPDSAGNAIAVFAGSSAIRFPAIYHARYVAASADFQSVTLTEASTLSYSDSTWGDYLDAAPDLASGYREVWVHGELAVTASTWKMRSARIPSTGCPLRRAELPSLAPPLDRASLFSQTCDTSSCPLAPPSALPAGPALVADFTVDPDRDLETITRGGPLAVYQVECCCDGRLLLTRSGSAVHSTWRN